MLSLWRGGVVFMLFLNCLFYVELTRTRRESFRVDTGVCTRARLALQIQNCHSTRGFRFPPATSEVWVPQGTERGIKRVGRV